MEAKLGRREIVDSLLRAVGVIVLVAVQWLLVLWGLLLCGTAILTYYNEISYLSALPEATSGQDSYTPPIFQRMLVGVVTGMIGIGLGVLLFYVRGIYLSRNR